MPSQVGTSTRVPFGDGVCFLLSISLDPLLSSGVAPVTPLRSQNGNVENSRQPSPKATADRPAAFSPFCRPSGSQTCRSSRRSRSRTPCTLRAPKGLWPCWTNPSERLRAGFFEHSLSVNHQVLQRTWGCWTCSIQQAYHKSQTFAVLMKRLWVSLKTRNFLWGRRSYPGKGRFLEVLLW